jgi:hypothetical protein
MVQRTIEPIRVTRGDALTIWAAARERAADDLAFRAAQLTGAAHWDAAAGLRAAARLLRQRAVQERAQAAACRTEKVDGPFATGACPQAAWSGNRDADHGSDRRQVGGRGRL